MANATDKREYEFTEDGFFGDTHYKKGSRDSFHPRQVRHQKHWIKPVAAEKPKVKPAAKAPAKKDTE